MPISAHWKYYVVFVYACQAAGLLRYREWTVDICNRIHTYCEWKWDNNNITRYYITKRVCRPCKNMVTHAISTYRHCEKYWAMASTLNKYCFHCSNTNPKSGFHGFMEYQIVTHFKNKIWHGVRRPFFEQSHTCKSDTTPLAIALRNFPNNWNKRAISRFLF